MRMTCVLAVLMLASAALAADAWESLNFAMMQDTLSGTDTLLVELIVPGDSLTVLAKSFYVYNSAGADILIGVTDSTFLPLRVCRWGDTAGIFTCPSPFSPGDGWRQFYIAGTSATDSAYVYVAFWYN